MEETEPRFHGILMANVVQFAISSGVDYIGAFMSFSDGGGYLGLQLSPYLPTSQ